MAATRGHTALLALLQQWTDFFAEVPLTAKLETITCTDTPPHAMPIVAESQTDHSLDAETDATNADEPESHDHDDLNAAENPESLLLEDPSTLNPEEQPSMNDNTSALEESTVSATHSPAAERGSIAGSDSSDGVLDLHLDDSHTSGLNEASRENPEGMGSLVQASEVDNSFGSQLPSATPSLLNPEDLTATTAPTPVTAPTAAMEEPQDTALSAPTAGADTRVSSALAADIEIWGCKPTEFTKIANGELEASIQPLGLPWPPEGITRVLALVSHSTHD